MLGPLYHLALKPQTPPVEQVFDGGLTVRAPSVNRNFVQHTFTWSGGVEALFGPTTLRSDQLVIHDAEEERFGEASGNVTLTDPEGTVTGSYIRFSWKDHTGEGRDVVVRVATLTLSAKRVVIEPGQWTLYDVGGTGCQLKTPVYYIRTSKLTVRPGIGGTAEKPQIDLFGKHIITLPTQNFSFGGGGNSISLPIPTYRSDRGFGISFANELPIGPDSLIALRYGAFQHALPFYSGYIFHSFLPSVTPIFPRSEMSERTAFGYMENVQVRDPESEQRYLRDRKLQIGVGTMFGADARGTTAGNKINKPAEAVGQVTGSLGSFGFLGIARVQNIGFGREEKTTRGVLEGNLGPPEIGLGGGLSLMTRFDGVHYVDTPSYTWARAQAGLLFRPTENLRFGAAYILAAERGKSRFEFDTLERLREFNFRADLDLDQTQIRFLLKYDPSRHSFFDQEVYVSQVIGCIEPFIVFRKHPRKFFVGLKLPISRVFDRLADRAVQRRVIISGPDK